MAMQVLTVEYTLELQLPKPFLARVACTPLLLDVVNEIIYHHVQFFRRNVLSLLLVCCLLKELAKFISHRIHIVAFVDIE